MTRDLGPDRQPPRPGRVADPGRRARAPSMRDRRTVPGLLEISVYDGVAARSVADVRAHLERIVGDQARGETVHWAIAESEQRAARRHRRLLPRLRGRGRRGRVRPAARTPRARVHDRGRRARGRVRLRRAGVGGRRGAHRRHQSSLDRRAGALRLRAHGGRRRSVHLPDPASRRRRRPQGQEEHHGAVPDLLRRRLDDVPGRGTWTRRCRRLLGPRGATRPEARAWAADRGRLPVRAGGARAHGRPRGLRRGASDGSTSSRTALRLAYGAAGHRPQPGGRRRFVRRGAPKRSRRTDHEPHGSHRGSAWRHERRAAPGAASAREGPR